MAFAAHSPFGPPARLGRELARRRPLGFAAGAGVASLVWFFGLGVMLVLPH